MKKTTLLVLLSVALFSAGCVSQGNKVLKDETSKTVSQKIIKGKTTKDQVRQIYGDPMTTSFTDSGKEIWKYEFTKGHATAASYVPIVNLFSSGATGDKKELVIFYNSNGVVVNYSMSTSKVDYDNSLFQ